MDNGQFKMKENNRVAFLDWTRFVACFMVMLVHSIEPFYLGDGGTLIGTRGDAIWCTVINSALRVAIGVAVATILTMLVLCPRVHPLCHLVVALRLLHALR